jgi:uncharacterized protein YbcC (UPF0753/DUF2309 family)
MGPGTTQETDTHPAHTAAPDAELDVRAAMERACARIAPTWPLDRFIAVNPLWGMIDRPLPEVSAELSALTGGRMLMPRAWYRDAWRAGRLEEAHLREAIAQTGSQRTVAELVALLQSAEPSVARRARVMDVADTQRDLVHEMPWRDFVVTSTSQLCASYFDDGQAQLRPDREGGLYATWRRFAVRDRSPQLLMGLRAYCDIARELPASAHEMARVALSELDVPADQRVTYLAALLLDLNGWAAWCAYRRWTARLAGSDDDHLTDLLAIRLAWEWLLHRAGGRTLAARWQHAMAMWPAIDAAARDAQDGDWLLQRAIEIAWQEDVCRRLPAGLSEPRPERVAVQAVFCIDVRSEVFRRALEAQTRAVQTLGFAGFFGLPIAYQPLGAPGARPQLPGLLAPRMRVAETAGAAIAERRAQRLGLGAAWKAFRTGAASAFTFVESMGLFYARDLLAESFGLGRSQPVDAAGLSEAEDAARRPRLVALADGGELTLDARCDLAAGMLRAMSLTRELARIVLLVGHGSATRNNPHAAGYDCGACCGQTGEVNARAAAALLNDPEVRDGLSARKITIPETTRFVAALHDTTTDEVTLFEADEIPSSHQADVAALRGWLEAAGHRARSERAPRLGLAGQTGETLRASLRARGRDWSEVRPEWGLADNAAFVVARRERVRHLDLAGRSFLHDYRHEEDEGFAILELIMTAPMVVTHWINFQYYASTVDNLRYGSGNKVLHNVVGGHIGVFEGNGGDLRIGLPLQALHDGERWMHTPLRLSVFLEAPRAAIEAILAKHETVRALVDNEWIHLFQIDADERAVHAYRNRRWVSTKSA